MIYLRFFIVSQVNLIKADESDAAIIIDIKKADGAKCERCWNYSETVGGSKEHPTICSRCLKVLL